MADARTPAEALERLREGNARFVAERTSLRARLSATQEMRAQLARGQAPFATVVCCSDSRVPAEMIFDQGLGDLFIVRNAGAVGGHAPLASIEYAVERLRTRLVVVLGHEGCGAFAATREVLAGARPPSESLRELTARLAPSLIAAGPDGTPDEQCARAARLHARSVAVAIARSPLVAPLVADGAVHVVPGYYSLTTGHVELSLRVRAGEADPAAGPAAAGARDGEGRCAHEAA
ncbi:MAG TPA: carbonic anhydrase [Planctomycetota bacterium]|nr:carbonic anhydrase [Planctomycetota bacterium]